MKDQRPEQDRFNDHESHLKETEKQSVSDALPPRAAVLHETIRTQGQEELERSVSALWWSALAAGLSMGFSMVAKGLIHAHLPDSGVRDLLSNFGYSVGFIIVIIARQQLFTENTLTAVLPLMHERSSRVLVQLLRLWGVVLVGNLAGTCLFAACLSYGNVFPEGVRPVFIQMGQALMANTSQQMFTKGIVAGWLIATMVWLIPAARESKIVIIVLMTYLIGIAELTHIIAAFTEAWFLMFQGQASLTAVLWHFGAPTLLGNIVGGSLIFALISHAQVHREV